jgi:hypothetical protein
MACECYDSPTFFLMWVIAARNLEMSCKQEVFFADKIR